MARRRARPVGRIDCLITGIGGVWGVCLAALPVQAAGVDAADDTELPVVAASLPSASGPAGRLAASLDALRGLPIDAVAERMPLTSRPAVEAPPLAAAARVEPEVIDYAALLRRGRASFGLGFAMLALRPADDGQGQAAGAGNELVATGAPALGFSMRYQMSPSSGFYLDSRSMRPGDEFAPRLRFGLEFKSARRDYSGLARGTLMRVQLSSASQVSLRLRGGRVGVQLRSSF